MSHSTLFQKSTDGNVFKNFPLRDWLVSSWPVPYSLSLTDITMKILLVFNFNRLGWTTSKTGSELLLKSNNGDTGNTYWNPKFGMIGVMSLSQYAIDQLLKLTDTLSLYTCRWFVRIPKICIHIHAQLIIFIVLLFTRTWNGRCFTLLPLLNLSEWTIITESLK